jgi:hypothetical protein
MNMNLYTWLLQANRMFYQFSGNISNAQFLEDVLILLEKLLVEECNRQETIRQQTASENLCKANPKRSQMSYNGAKTCKTCSTSPTE